MSAAAAGDKPRAAVDQALQAQAAARANAEGLQDAMRDLMNWEAKVKKKDDGLRKMQNIVRKPVRPVRNAAAPAAAAVPTAASFKKKATQKPIPGSDFRAWDKYDVGAALDALDAEEAEDARGVNLNSVDDEAKRARELQEHMGNEEKERGNAQFKQGKYAAAIECYSRGIELDPLSSALVANRAMARLKMKKYAEAEADCSLAIELSPKYIKAWQRRATARVAQNKLEAALSDYKMVVKLDPSNASARKEIKTLPQRIKDAKEKARLAFRPLAHAGDSTTLSAVKAKQVLHRIPIEEIGSSDEEDAPTKLSGSEKIALVDGVVSGISDVRGKSKSIENANGTLVGGESGGDLPGQNGIRVQIQESNSDSDSDSDALATERAIGVASDAPLSQKTAVESTIAPASKKQRKSAEKVLPTSPTSTSLRPVKRSEGSPNGKITPAAFEARWRRLDSEGLCVLLESIEARRIPSLIKNNLCAELLAAIFRCLEAYVGQDRLQELAVLGSLLKTKRFDQTLMFLDDKELKPLRAVISVLRDSPSTDQAELNRVSAAYSV